jgi:hypothetical protein
MPRPKPLTTLEADRAVYIDFEKCVKNPPSLVGILWAPTDPVTGRVSSNWHFEQAVLETALHTAARATGGPCIACSLDAKLLDLVELVVREDRLIVAWSVHDLAVIEEYFEEPASVVKSIRDRYRNALHTVRPWRRRTFPHVTLTSNSLYEYLRLTGFRVRPHVGRQKVAKQIRAVREQLRSGKAYGALTPNAKRHWGKILEHNRNDCLGMRKVIEIAVSDS